MPTLLAVALALTLGGPPTSLALGRDPSLPVQVVLAGDLPFSREELIDALALRMPGRAAARPAALVVRADAPDHVVVTLGAKRRSLELEGRRSVAAARRVAIEAADLATTADPDGAPSVAAAASAPSAPT